jgi:hypothetical protein
MKIIGILSHLVETGIGGKGKDTLSVETGIAHTFPTEFPHSHQMRSIVSLLL